MHSQVGVSAFRIDLGVVDPDAPGRYLAGVECDGATYHRSATARDRDKLREQVLRGLGWDILRIWSTDWWIDMQGTVEKIHDQLEALLNRQRANRAKTEEEASILAEQVIADVMAMPDERAGDSKEAVENAEATTDKPEDGAMPPTTYARNAAVACLSDPIEPRFIEVDLTLEGYEVDASAFFDVVYNPTLLRLIEHVVRVEGPVRDEVLARRIARAHGWVRTGAKIQDRVVRLASQHYKGDAEDVGTFFNTKGDSVDVQIRFRRPVDGAARSVDEISLAELRALACEMMRAGHEEESGVLAMAREVGLRKLSAGNRARLELAWLEARNSFLVGPTFEAKLTRRPACPVSGRRNNKQFFALLCGWHNLPGQGLRGINMGWGFRKSIKIAPGIRVNLSKSGISTSFGGKGFTYNTRGRVSASIPGTGIRYTTNLRGQKSNRRAGPGAAASTGFGYMNTENLSKREQATQEFVHKVRARTTNALLQYFFSHGVFVDEDDISEAIALEEHQPFLNTLSHDLSLTTKAIKLAIDIGTVSLAEKEKAMLAVYELEHKCAAARGGRGDLQTAASTLLARVLAWPRAPGFMGPLFAGLLGCLLIVVLSVPTGLALAGFALAYGGYKAFSFIRKKAVASEAIKEANGWFESQLAVEVTPRPTIHAGNDYVPLKAAGFAAAVVAAAAYTLIVYPHHATPQGDVEQVVHQADAVTPAIAGTNGAAPGVVAAAADNRSHPVEDFSWLAGRYPSDVVNDRRFRSAFNGISRTEWKKISERLAVTNSASIQSQTATWSRKDAKNMRAIATRLLSPST